MEGGQWADQKLKWTLFQSLRCRSRVHEYRGRESLSKTSTSSEPRLDAQAAMQSGTTKEHKHTQIVAECELRSDSEPLRMGQSDLDRGNEVVNEAVAGEVRRGRAGKEEK